MFVSRSQCTLSASRTPTIPVCRLGVSSTGRTSPDRAVRSCGLEWAVVAEPEFSGSTTSRRLSLNTTRSQAYSPMSDRELTAAGEELTSTRY
jgi:hypothetical protein